MTTIAPLCAAAVLTLAAGLAGCSPGSNSTPAAPAPSLPAPSSSTPMSPTAPSSTAGPSSTKSPGSPSASSAAAATISIKAFAYSSSAAVAPGASVTATNSDSEAHTVTADKGSTFDTKVNGGGNASATFRAPNKPGRYPFHCKFHEMHGVLVVK